MRVTVVNRGTSRTAGTSVTIQDIEPDGKVGATAVVGIPELAPNENFTAVVGLTVTTYVNQQHTFRAIVDLNNTIPESNENNNTGGQANYVLSGGNC